MNPSAAVWAASIGAVLVLLAVDLYVSARRSSESLQRSVITSSLWIFVAVVFGVGVLFWYGPEWGAQYFAGYVTEKALSVDNLFVFAVVLGALGVAEGDRPKVLRYGIAGALVARAGLIFAGVGLLEHFAWASYVLGGLVLATGLRMVAGRRRGEGTAGPAPRWLARVRPASLLVAVGMLEAVDVAFALDSVPAVLAITRVPYLAFMSNAFAVVGLRSLYFVLERALVRLR
ncbi:MAG: TerC family protein, partial [Solirubrobacteraceae bacterium]